MGIEADRYISGAAIRADEARLTDELTKKIGYAFALYLAEQQGVTPDALAISVGHDSRPSGPRLAHALIEGLTAADADVYECGPATTPAMHMTVQSDAIGASGAVMITASADTHSKNGFKFITRDGSITEDGVRTIMTRALTITVPRRLVSPLDVMGRYADRLREMVRANMEEEVQKPLLGLHVVVDAAGGVGEFYRGLLESLGANTAGSLAFAAGELPPERSANPEKAEALRTLSAAVVENHADLGVIFDADGDRAALVDQTGRAINRNRLIALIAAIYLDEETGLTFVTDSVTSSGLTRFITEWGGTHYRFKRGYLNVIEEAKRLNEENIDCPIAIETSGHAALRENYFIDDGMYLVTRILCEAMYRKRDGKTLSSLLDELQEPVESVEIRLPIIQEDYKKAAHYVIEAVLSRTLDDRGWKLAPDNREGVRILFSLDGGVDNAWLMLRLSVHDPVMPLNAESDVPGGLKKMLTELHEVLAQDNEELDLTPLEKTLEKLAE